MTDTAKALLARAEELLAASDGGAVGNSARLAAVLARQAVEDLIDARCAELCGVPAIGGRWKSKLAVLKSLDTSPAGGILIGAWHQLTGFCHQHAYQLSPTVGEVRSQCDAVARCC
ncbi:hypothetical protein MU0083_001765 [[Mycobacterium] kokjensenii]|uniref:HNH endonuclease n=1 Tax=[Mycobacterium] kokjensenii TaxID=3064287 RepID=A0ABN9MZD6_9MYCO|nr:hypothetical protein [Mycolicibacter sp. MU0083]CAJ1497792.1 hypothetical protein MU0083_001765 [Mycolicibacter sp. MU0083]